MTKEKLSKWLKKGIVAALALMSLLTLCFSLIKVDLPYYPSENGFDMLSFESDYISGDYKWGATMLGVCSVLELVFACIAICLSIFNFVKTKESKAINTGIVGGAIAVAVLYLVEGIVFKAVLGSTVSGLKEYLSTVAFVPMIIIGVFVVAYFLVAPIVGASSLGNENVENGEAIVVKKEKVSSVVRSNQQTVEAQSIENLKKYKDLLDMGVITQEEFEAKKKELLNIK